MVGIIKRKKTRALQVGTVQVGGDAPVVVQSMTNTDTRDVKSTVRQIKRLEKAGCEIVRVAVPDEKAAKAIGAIKSKIAVPLVADIHFDHRLALIALEQGADGVRINPGNMKKGGIREVVNLAKDTGAVIRIGVNAGSLEKDILKKYGQPGAEALVESAIRHVRLMEDMGFHAMKLSVKSSDVLTMIEAYRRLSAEVDYPLHLGVTEAGTLVNAAVKSAIGIGTLLMEGIGDTIRVSVTGDPVREISLAYAILRALNIRRIGVDVIACPTCGRCQINLEKLVREVERRIANVKEPIKVALMGCVVNGPGEAAHADIGIAGGKGYGMLFKKGEIIRSVREEDFVCVLMTEIGELLTIKKED
ncbi:MAG: flavodoxin-dependent (E)-4-hydroxy-3-methylbut-2-enyl-diphosphate synthase [Syntrophales bacterium]|nr:flavodoxin-dependent (E)-4-hydroxy-3-methylbut-2-enyl-diphosphate synthase [Syntrophales bacterium]